MKAFVAFIFLIQAVKGSYDSIKRCQQFASAKTRDMFEAKKLFDDNIWNTAYELESVTESHRLIKFEVCSDDSGYISLRQQIGKVNSDKTISNSEDIWFTWYSEGETKNCTEIPLL